MKQVLVGITGASGSKYAVRLLQELQQYDIRIHLILSEPAKNILSFETDETLDSIRDLADHVYENDDLFAGPSSGSFQLDGMAIVPCSMKTISSIAQGYADTLITRSAMCMLKEHKPLVVVPRETPIDLISLKNMVKVSEAGGIVLPAAPGFYHQPSTISELVNFIVGKILDQFSLSHDLFKRWGEQK